MPGLSTMPTHRTRGSRSSRKDGPCLLRLLLTLPTFMTGTLQADDGVLDWFQLPPLPDPVGLAGSFAGVSGEALIVAGGANFPTKMPWDGGRKVWHDSAFVLDRTNGVWDGAFHLPRPLAYGVSVTTSDGVLCIGGSDSREHHREVFLLRWQRGTLATTHLASLPQPLANACGARVGQTVYVAGGTQTPDATNALRRFHALDLSKPGAVWEELPPWPGPARLLAVAASLDGDFYLVGGTDLCPDPDGRPVRTYLKDAYRFRPGAGWARVADLPNPVVAAPTPAPVIAPGTFLVIGGDDGTLAGFEPRSRHPGFPKRVLRYEAVQDAWSVAGPAPVSRATLPAVAWQGLFVIPSGESRPGVRSPEVWAVRAGPSQ